MSEETTETTEESHANTDESAVEESGNLLDTGDEVVEVETAETTEQEVTPFELPEQYQDNPRFEGIDSQEALLAKIAESGAPEKYSFPEGFDDDLATAISEHAIQADMSQEQVETLLAFKQSQDKAVEKSMWAEIDKGVEDLKTEWGEEFEANVKDAKKALLAFDTDGELVKLIKSRPDIGNHPTVLKYLKSVQAAVDVDKFLDSEGNPQVKRPTDKDGVPYLSSYDTTMR